MFPLNLHFLTVETAKNRMHQNDASGQPFFAGSLAKDTDLEFETPVSGCP